MTARRLVLLACLVALALRVVGLGAGLPRVLQVDEPAYTGPAVELGPGAWAPRRQWAPTGFTYAVVGLRELLARVPALEHALRASLGAGDDARAWHAALGRLVSAVTGALGVLAAAALARAAAGPRAGALAAWVLALDFLHGRQSHFGVPDVAMVGALTLAVAASAAAARDGSAPRLVGAGAACGLAAVTKLPGAVGLVAVVAAGLVAPGWRPRRRAGAIVAALLAAAAVFVAVDPWVLLEPRSVLADVRYALEHGDAVAEGQPRGPVALVHLAALARDLGPLLAVALLGVTALGRRTAVVVLCVPLVYAATMWTRDSVYVRYALPFVPFLAVLAGAALAHLPGGRPATAAAALLLLWPAVQLVRFDQLLLRADTRERAGRWLLEQRGPRDVVLLDGVSEWLPRGIPSPPQRRLYMHHELAGLLATGEALGVRPRFLVVESWMDDFWDPARTRARRLDPDPRAFYASLPERFAVAARVAPTDDTRELPFHYEQIFGPWNALFARERPGPGVVVYDLHAPVR